MSRENQDFAERFIRLEIENNAELASHNYGNYNIEGLGPDAPLADDGLQSKTEYRFDLVPPLAIAKVASVLYGGAVKYGSNSWLRLDNPSTHINHCLGHIAAYTAGDTQEGTPEDHLYHALCRLLFAVDVIERKKQSGSPLRVPGDERG